MQNSRQALDRARSRLNKLKSFEHLIDLILFKGDEKEINDIFPDPEKTITTEIKRGSKTIIKTKKPKLYLPANSKFREIGNDGVLTGKILLPNNKGIDMSQLKKYYFSDYVPDITNFDKISAASIDYRVVELLKQRDSVVKSLIEAFEKGQGGIESPYQPKDIIGNNENLRTILKNNDVNWNDLTIPIINSYITKGLSNDPFSGSDDEGRYYESDYSDNYVGSDTPIDFDEGLDPDADIDDDIEVDEPTPDFMAPLEQEKKFDTKKTTEKLIDENKLISDVVNTKEIVEEHPKDIRKMINYDKLYDVNFKEVKDMLKTKYFMSDFEAHDKAKDFVKKRMNNLDLLFNPIIDKTTAIKRANQEIQKIDKISNITAIKRANQQIEKFKKFAPDYKAPDDLDLDNEGIDLVPSSPTVEKPKPVFEAIYEDVKEDIESVEEKISEGVGKVIGAVEEIPGGIISGVENIPKTVMDHLRPLFANFKFFETDRGQKKILVVKIKKHTTENLSKLTGTIDLNPEKRSFIKNLISTIQSNKYFTYVYELLSITEIYEFLMQFTGIVFTTAFLNSILEFFGVSIINMIGVISTTAAALISVVGPYLIIFATVMFFISILISTGLYVSKFGRDKILPLISGNNPVSDNMKSKFNDIMKQVDVKLNNISFF